MSNVGSTFRLPCIDTAASLSKHGQETENIDTQSPPAPHCYWTRGTLRVLRFEKLLTNPSEVVRREQTSS